MASVDLGAGGAKSGRGTPAESVAFPLTSELKRKVN